MRKGYDGKIAAICNQEFIIYRRERVSSSQYTPYKITALLAEIL